MELGVLNYSKKIFDVVEDTHRFVGVFDVL